MKNSWNKECFTWNIGKYHSHFELIVVGDLATGGSTNISVDKAKSMMIWVRLVWGYLLSDFSLKLQPIFELSSPWLNHFSFVILWYLMSVMLLGRTVISHVVYLYFFFLFSLPQVTVYVCVYIFARFQFVSIKNDIIRLKSIELHFFLCRCNRRHNSWFIQCARG